MKSNIGKLGWHFPSLNGADIQGFHDALQEYFQGNHERAVAREIIQNSLDARKNYKKPVVVEFERLLIPTENLVGINQLEDIFMKAKLFAKGQTEADEFYENAVKLLKSENISVLRASDYNTWGVTGKDRDHDQPWCQLTGSIGISTKSGEQGGTFGIGKGAPFVASKFRVVYYNTLSAENEPIFMGKCRISSFSNLDDEFSGIGNFGIKETNRALSVREKNMIPEIFKGRDEAGTDIFIAGYDADDNWQKELILSVLQNFWAAIYFEDLTVHLIDGKTVIDINKKTLEKHLRQFDEQHHVLPFYEAVTSPNYKKSIKLHTIGTVDLFLKLGEGFPRKIQLMRASRMFIDEYPARILRDPYAGVFICSDKKGNELLRGLEPPAHDEWIAERKEYGGKILREMYNWIKDCLREVAGESAGKPNEIPELNKYLPEIGEEDDKSEAMGSKTETKEDRESSREKVEEKEREQIETQYPVKKSVSIMKAGEGDLPILHKKKPKPGPPPGPEPLPGPGSGSLSRLDTSMIKFRSFAVSEAKGISYKFTITSSIDQEGDLKIIATGEDAEYDADFVDAVGIDDGRHYETT